MNIQNIDKAISIMERATNLRMAHWQTCTSNFLVNSIEDLHACGNEACFAGYIAISDEFKADGGRVHYSGGCPIFNSEYGELAISTWLEVSDKIGTSFVQGNLFYNEAGNEISRFYNKEWSKVEPSDVIAKLKELKELSEDAFTEKYIAL